MGKQSRKVQRSASRTAERVTEEERGELVRLVEAVGILERQVQHGRAKLDAYVLDLETKYKLRPGAHINSDTGVITRRPT